MSKRGAFGTLAAAVLTTLSLAFLAPAPPASAGLTGTTTNLAVSSTSTTYGNESSIVFTVDVSGGINIGGTVTVATPTTTLCTLTLPTTTCSMTKETLLPAASAAYSVKATYSGNLFYSPSTSSAIDLTVGPASTTTSLSLSTPSVTYGNESTITFTSAVTSSAGTPGGTVTIATGSTNLCTITLPATTCHPTTDTTLDASASAYPVTATYDDTTSTDFATSASSPADLTVHTATTATTLSLSAGSTTYGSESSVVFTATVTPQFDGTPHGTVTVATGTTTLCTITLPATTCSTGETKLAPSSTSYPVVAGYGGDASDANFSGSMSGTRDLTIGEQTTTTALSLSTSSTSYGNESKVSFRVTVTPLIAGTPTGLVTVATGSTTLCTFDLSSATSCTTGDTKLGPSGAAPYPVTASYAGDASFSGSASAAADLTVNQATTSTTVALSASSVGFGNESSVSFTAAVSPEFQGTPGGRVTVATGTTTLCTITLPATKCSAADALLDASSSPYAVTATYGGDANFSGSTSTPADLTVNQAATSTTLSLSATSVGYGNEASVTFTAAVSPQFQGTPGGTVTIATGGTTLCTISLAATTTCTAKDTALGAQGATYPVTASYGGGANFTGSTSAPHDLKVEQATTSTTVSLSATSVGFGDESSIVFTADVTPQFAGTPTGTVTIATGSTTLCTIALPAATTCSAQNDAVKASATPYAVTATFGGDTNFSVSASASHDLTVTASNTSTSLTLSQPTVTYGNETAVTFTVSVTSASPGTPTGTVTVASGGTTLCTVTLPTASPLCTVSSAAALATSTTAYPVTADYGGDTNFAGSTSSEQDLTVNQATTTTTVVSTSATAPYGDESTITFNASVSPQFSGTPAGTVTVATGSTTLCTMTLPATKCSAPDALLGVQPAPYSVTATYGGDGNFSGSTSAPADLTVTQAATSTTLSLSTSSVAQGSESSVVFTATVTPEFHGTPTGTVTVATGTTTLCTITLPTTTCSMPDGTIPKSATPYPITATYGGDTNLSGSASSTQDLTVTAVTSSTSLTLSSSSVAFGNESTVTFTAVVTTASGTPTGIVTVTSGGTTLCSMTLPTTTCRTTDMALPAAVGADPIVATYGGDTNVGGSTSPSRTLTVTKASSSTTVTLSAESVAYGSEESISFAATATPQFDGTPTGTVTIATGSTTLCTIDLPQTSCSPAGQETLPPQATAYPVIATYGGDTDFTGSASATHDLTVNQAATTTSLTLSASSVGSDDESSVVFTAVVTPASGSTPTGVVAVATPTTTLCTITLPTATTCSMPDGTLAASQTPYSVTATYGGDANFSGSASPPSSLTVTTVNSTTSLSLSSPAVAYGGESGLVFTAVVTPLVTGTPSGTVTITTGSTTLCTIDVAVATTCTMGQTALNAEAAAYPVVATYSGDGTFTPSASTPQDLTVVRGTPSSPSITNVPGGATEEGSFVAGVATNGDGARSVSSSTPSVCTVAGDGVTVNFLVGGSCTLTAQVGAGSNYNGAAGHPQTFTVAFAPRGYWLVGSDGGIFSFGAASFHGSMGGVPLQRPVVGITPTASRQGYWLVASDGGIFSFGDSGFYGSIPALGLHPAGSGVPNSLSAPIVAVVPSSTGHGYFMVGSDGGVFAFGDAHFAGSCPGIGGCAGTAVAVMPDRSGNGYWLVTTTGSVYAFGDAPFFGTPPGQPDPVVDAVAAPNGQGYWILFASGAVYGFGSAPGAGGPGGYVNSYNPATAIFPTADGQGYWVAAAHGDVFSYGNAPFLGSMASTPLNGPIIAASGF